MELSKSMNQISHLRGFNLIEPNSFNDSLFILEKGIIEMFSPETPYHKEILI